jgi:hypothetical protein
MNQARLARIGNRINVELTRRLGQGVDVARLIDDAVYARDVLLVCDAHPGSDLDSLARHFRIAIAEPVDDLGLPSVLSDFGAEASGFDPSRPMPIDLELPLFLPSAPKRWLARLFGD